MATGMILLFIAAKFFLGYKSDESKDMQPVAVAIATDAVKIRKEPYLVITMPVMGNGLLYYLNGPEYVRLQKNQGSAGAELRGHLDKLRTDSRVKNKGHSAQLAAALNMKLDDSQAEYIVFQASSLEKYEKRFGDNVKLVMANSSWAVWRRVRMPGPDFDWKAGENL